MIESGTVPKILIVGAGIAGAALARRLAQSGVAATIIDRELDGHAGGYMLGLLPIGGTALQKLALFEPYLAASCAVSRYELFDAKGRRIKRVSLAAIADRPGAYRGIERGRLLDLLRGCGSDMDWRWGVTVADLTEHPDHVAVTFSDERTDSYDLVIGADGMRSSIRRLRFGPDAAEPFDTGWGGWVGWTTTPDDECYRELWGAGWFVGLYPVRGRLGVFIGGSVRAIGCRNAQDWTDRIRARLPDGPFAAALRDIAFADPPFFWAMADRRSKDWRSDRTILLGDAAAGFLPTAGIGASIAMESAVALADTLLSADRPTVSGEAFARYERRQRARVERAQASSRRLARLMFIDSPIPAFLRDALLRLYPAGRMAADIAGIVQ